VLECGPLVFRRRKARPEAKTIVDASAITVLIARFENRALSDRVAIGSDGAAARDPSSTGPFRVPFLMLDFRRLRANDILSVRSRYNEHVDRKQSPAFDLRQWHCRVRKKSGRKLAQLRHFGACVTMSIVKASGAI
jgi:hypothetical protein